MDKQEIENLVSLVFDDWYDLEESVQALQPDYDKISFLCKELRAYLENIEEMSYELKKRESKNGTH